MYPAPSIIFFTVLSGLGLGMVAVVGLGVGPDDGAYPVLASTAALVLTATGGVCSVGHLGRRENAWRAFSQWRSSWLSREAWLMAAALAVFLVYALAWSLGGGRLWWLGWLAAALAVAANHATAMIYAQLRTVPRWSATPTPVLFQAFGLTGGLLAAGAVAGIGDAGVPAWWAVLGLVIATVVAIWWQTAAAGATRGSQGSTAETATGLGHMGRVRLFEAPHTGSNYLLSEMAYRVGRNRAFQLRLIGAVLGFALPLVLVLLSLAAGWLMLPAFLAHLVGMLALRWLFFAEAEHVQALYYGRR